MVLAIIILSQIGEYLTIVSSPARSVMKNLILAVIILNGAFLNLIVTPRLIRVSFGESHLHAPGELRRLRKLAFALSGVSLASWYSLVFTDLLKNGESAGLGKLFTIYGAALAVALSLNHIIELLTDRPVKKEV